MSINGLQNTNLIINTIDGLTNIWATDIYENGQKLSVAGLVPYTGANQMVDLNNQTIRTTHTPSNNADLINLETLTNAVTFVDTSVSLTYLNKITTTPQTVAGKVTFNKELAVINNKKTNLSSKLVVDSNYKSNLTSGSITTTQGLGTITNVGIVYQVSTTSTNPGILNLFPITAGTRYRFSIELLGGFGSTATYLQTSQSEDGINPSNIIDNRLFPTGSTNFETLDYTFEATVTGNIIIEISTDDPSGITGLKWKNFTSYNMGVYLDNITTTITASKVPIINDKQQLVSSGVDSIKITYLDNVSSDIQTQLNNKVDISTLSDYALLAGNNTFTGNNQFQNGNTTTTGITSFKNNSACDIDKGYELNAAFQTSTFTRRLGRISFLRNAGGTDYSGYMGLDVSTDGALYKRMLTLHKDNGVSAGANKITTTYTAVNNEDVVNKGSLNTVLGSYVLKSGDTMTGTLIQTIAGVSAQTTAFLSLSNTENHYDGNPSTTYVMSGPSGYLTLARKTTRNDTEACLMMGTNNELSELVSRTTDGSDWMPLNYACSQCYFVGVNQPYSSRASNPQTPQFQIRNHTNGQRLYLGTYYTGGSGSCSTIQTSDFYSGADHGTDLLINPLGGYVSIGSYGVKDPVAKFTINSDYGADEAGGFCINASDGTSSANFYRLHLFPYVQSGGNVAYRFRTKNQGTSYESFSILSTGVVQFLKEVQITGNNVINFGADQSKEANAGKIGYGVFDTGALAIVGAGFGSNRRVRIWDTLGVGRRADSYQLEIQGTGYFTSDVITGGQISVGSLINMANGYFQIQPYAYGSNNMMINCGGSSNLLLYPTGGNVGVGFSANGTQPSYKLHVNGSFMANDWIRQGNNNAGLYWEGLGYGIVSPQQQGNSYGNITTYGNGSSSWQGYGIRGRYCFMAYTFANDWGIHDNLYSWLIRGPGGSNRQVFLGGGSVMACQDWDLFVVWRSGIELDWGSGYFYVNKGGGYGMASDERIKKNIEPIEYKQSTDFIRAIKPSTFCLKQGHSQKVKLADGTETEQECGIYCNCRESGFIAQNVLEACNKSGVPKSCLNHWYDYEQQLNKPEEERTAILGVCDRPILSHTVNVVKHLLNENETLKEEIKQLKDIIYQHNELLKKISERLK